MSTGILDALDWDIVTGRRTGLPQTIRKAVAALDRSRVPYAVAGAVALGARGCVRMTLDLDVVVLADDAETALRTLARAGFRGETELEADEVEPQYVLIDPATGMGVDVLVGFGEPEVSLVREATRIQLSGTRAQVARREHLLIQYLYSNQPRHLGDFAALVQQGRVSLSRVRALVAKMHPEMVPTLLARWEAAANPPPAPERPPRPPRRHRVRGKQR